MGFLPTFLFGLSPTVLAHGHYVTTDIAATFGICLATYLFLKFLLHSSNKNLVWAGIGFGIAELTKLSDALLIPYLLIIALVYAGVRVLGERKWWYYVKSLILIFIIGYVLVYAAYFLFTLNYPQQKQLEDATQILASFTPHWLADINLAMIKSEVLRPLGEYFLGLLMILQRSAGGNTGYFMGEVSAAGWWYYFPTLFLLKEPLPSLILILLGLILACRNMVKSSRMPTLSLRTKTKSLVDYLGTHFPEFAMAVFIIIYWGYSMRSPLNIGIRHLMPTLPLIYILTAGSLKNWFHSKIVVP